MFTIGSVVFIELLSFPITNFCAKKPNQAYFLQPNWKKIKSYEPGSQVMPQNEILLDNF